VYVVVVLGATVIEEVVSPPGDQRYVPPPADGLAVNVTLPPEHIVPSLFAEPEVSASEIVTEGADVTVTVALAGAPEQPPEEYVTE
jgi:hypothetical protein